MVKIGLLSDTHSWLDEKIFNYFSEVDEIWHAGDIGDVEVANTLEKFKPMRAVYGNIDGGELRVRFPEDQIFTLEAVSVLMTHIGGYPPRYTPDVKKRLNSINPRLFICGHSHILRVMPDSARPGMLYINPGASGIHGFHIEKTIVRFNLDAGSIRNLEVINLGKRAKI